MDVVEFIAERELEECLRRSGPDIPQDEWGEWEELYRTSTLFKLQQLSIALRGVFFAFCDMLPWARREVRRHAVQWCAHPDYREEWWPR